SWGLRANWSDFADPQGGMTRGYRAKVGGFGQTGWFVLGGLPASRGIVLAFLEPGPVAQDLHLRDPQLAGDVAGALALELEPAHRGARRLPPPVDHFRAVVAAQLMTSPAMPKRPQRSRHNHLSTSEPLCPARAPRQSNSRGDGRGTRAGRGRRSLSDGH